MAAGGMNASSTSPDTSGYSGPAPVGGDTTGGFLAPPPSTVMGRGGKQAGNPMPPPSGSLDAYAQPYNPMTPDGAGGSTMRMPEPSYGGNPAPSFGNNPPAPRSDPSMTAMPPTNPNPAPPQPRMQPAVMPPYGGGYQPGMGMGMGMDRPQMSPLRQFRMGYPDRYAEMPADRIPQREMFDRGPFGRREQQPGGPTWSQQGGVFNYDPNGRPAGGGPFGMFRNMPEGFNPFGGMFGGQMPDFPSVQQRVQDFIAQLQQQQADRLAQVRSGVSPDQPRSPEDVVSRNGMSVSDIKDRARAAGLGAINPYKPQG